MANPEQYDFYITTPNLKLGAQDLPPSHHLSFFNETDIRLGTKTEALSDLPHPSELLPPSESDIPEFDPSELLPDYDPKFNMNLVVYLDLLSS